MEFVTINYKDNKEYYVEKNVIKDAILKKLKKEKEIKVNDVIVKITNNNILIEIELAFIKGELSKILPELQETVNFEILSLTNLKPENINIVINEVKNG